MSTPTAGNRRQLGLQRVIRVAFILRENPNSTSRQVQFEYERDIGEKVSRRTIFRCILLLEKMGYVFRERVGRTPHYTFDDVLADWPFQGSKKGATSC